MDKIINDMFKDTSTNDIKIPEEIKQIAGKLASTTALKFLFMTMIFIVIAQSFSTVLVDILKHSSGSIYCSSLSNSQLNFIRGTTSIITAHIFLIFYILYKLFKSRHMINSIKIIITVLLIIFIIINIVGIYRLYRAISKKMVVNGEYCLNFDTKTDYRFVKTAVIMNWILIAAELAFILFI